MAHFNITPTTLSSEKLNPEAVAFYLHDDWAPSMVTLGEIQSAIRCNVSYQITRPGEQLLLDEIASPIYSPKKLAQMAGISGDDSALASRIAKGLSPDFFSWYNFGYGVREGFLDEKPLGGISFLHYHHLAGLEREVFDTNFRPAYEQGLARAKLLLGTMRENYQICRDLFNGCPIE